MQKPHLECKIKICQRHVAMQICSRKKKLYPFPPPGYTDIVHDRTINK